MALPPSPALSACDSLADIDDLDAYLDSQPALSHFPTPPLNEQRSPPRTPIDACHEACSTSNLHIAEIVAQAANGFQPLTTSADIQAIDSILTLTGLPLEILVIAYNILNACPRTLVGAWPSSASVHVSRVPLNVVAALSLAVSYSHDHAPTSSWWSQYVCQGTWAVADINHAVLAMYAAVDWNLHRCTDARAMADTTAHFQRRVPSNKPDSLSWTLMPKTSTPTPSITPDESPALVRTTPTANTGCG